MHLLHSSWIIEYDVDCDGAFAGCGLELEPRRLRVARLSHTGTEPYTARRQSERHQQLIVALTQQQWPKQVKFYHCHVVLLVARDYTLLTMNTSTSIYSRLFSTLPDVTQCNALYAPLNAISNKFTLLLFTFHSLLFNLSAFQNNFSKLCSSYSSVQIIRIHFRVYSLESITSKFIND